MPTEAELRYLYLEEGLTERQLGAMFGLTQMQVNRLRKTWGVPTISKADRIRLPPLTSQQRSLLLGSLLGDARLLQTGSATAALSEFHSETQSEYLRWKTELWGPWICSVRPSSSTKNGRTYKGQILRTWASRELYPYWQAVYPEGSGDKTFLTLDLSEADGLSLAVWYLDDGSKTSNGYVRFFVTPDEASRQVQLDLLRRFGLDPVVYSEGGDYTIWLHDRASLTRFIDLVSEHVPPCMSSKLELVPRCRGESPQKELSKDRLTSFASEGRSVQWVAQAVNSTPELVRRALRKHGLELSGKAPSWEEASETIQMGVSEETLLDLLVALEMPEAPSSEEVHRDFSNLQERTLTHIENGAISGGGRVGLTVCEAFFSYRYEAFRKGIPSVQQAWFDRTQVAKAIAFQRKVGDPVLPRNVFRAVKALNLAPSNFRPAVAKRLVEEFSPMGGIVLDPCAGYGGRAVGCCAAGRKYVGVDPHPKALSAFERLNDLVGGVLEFHDSPFEEVQFPDSFADMALTSPPYFSVERYSNDSRQSWVRYPTWDLWVERFLKVLIAKTYNCLRPGRHFLLNVSDSLVQASTEIADSVGFRHEDTLQMRLASFGKRRRYEPILVLLKPDSGTCLVPYKAPPKGPVVQPYYETGVQGLTSAVLQQLYAEELKTDAEIGSLYGVSDVLISQQRKRYGIVTLTPRQRSEKKHGGPSLDGLTRERLEELCQTLSDSKIASIYGTTKVTIRNWRNRFGISR